MKDWWSMDPKWRHVLVFQFNFHVLMHLFGLCYWKLDETDYFRRLIDKSDLDKFRNIETLLGDYILRMEKREDYQEETTDTRTWLLGYGVEYAQLIWAAGAVEDSAANGRKRRTEHARTVCLCYKSHRNLQNPSCALKEPMRSIHRVSSSDSNTHHPNHPSPN